MQKLILTLMGLCWACILPLSAQQLYIRQVYSAEAKQKQAESSKENAEKQRGVERKVAEFLRNYSEDAVLRFKKDSLSPLPIVFHVVHDAKSKPVEESLLRAQIEALNRDFGATEPVKNPKFPYPDAVAKETGISFCLAETKGNGEALNYYQTNRADWGFEELLATANFGLGKPLDGKKYINIWVADLADDFAGYAQLPGGPDEIDGIVIDADLIGPRPEAKHPYKQGKTLAHLMGTYLGLLPLWGEGPCSDDYVEDTPVHNAPNFEYWPFGHVSTCMDNPREMLENFMDSTPDSVRTFFTKGQVRRMYAMLAMDGPRSGLWKGKTECGTPRNPETEARETAATTEMPETKVDVFPNPTDGVVRIAAQSVRPLSLRIFSETGAQVFLRENMPESLTLDCREWANGVYLLTFYAEGKLVARKTVSVNHP